MPIIVWDNASDTPTTEEIKNSLKYSDVQFVRSETNLGFAGRNNAAAARNSGTTYLLTVKPNSILATCHVQLLGKNMPGILLWLSLPRHLPANLMSAVVLMVRRQLRVACLGKRRRIQRARLTVPLDMLNELISSLHVSPTARPSYLAHAATSVCSSGRTERETTTTPLEGAWIGRLQHALPAGRVEWRRWRWHAGERRSSRVLAWRVAATQRDTSVIVP